MFPEGPEGAGSHTLCLRSCCSFGGVPGESTPLSETHVCAVTKPTCTVPWRSEASVCLLMTSLSVCVGLARPFPGPRWCQGLGQARFSAEHLETQAGVLRALPGGKALVGWEQALVRDCGWTAVSSGRTVTLANSKAWEATGV